LAEIDVLFVDNIFYTRQFFDIDIRESLVNQGL